MPDDPKSSVTIRMPAQLLLEIKMNAEKNSRSINSEIVHALNAIYVMDLNNPEKFLSKDDNTELANILKSLGMASVLSVFASPLIPIAISAIHNAAKSMKKNK